MLSNDSLPALMAYAFVMTITPGPNNVLLLASGLAFGLRRTTGHIAGILAGTQLQIGLVGAGLGVLFTSQPVLQEILKLAGSVYMLWLTRQLWHAGEARTTVAPARPVRFHEAAAFQFVNPKTWLMATTMIAAFVPPGEHYAARVAASGLVFAAVALPCIGLWAGSGEALRAGIRNPVTLQRINRVMAMLAATTVLLFWL